MPLHATAADPDGVRRIPVQTPAGTFEVWTRQVGEHPDVKVLVLHGGPGATHEYLLDLAELAEPAHGGFELYFYDQLGSAFSDQPEGHPELWEIDRFVDEVEQVRQALGLDADSFVLYGQSWGGILAIEYALAHPEHLKGLVISNMMASIPAYNAYAEQTIMPALDQDVLAEIKLLEAEERTEDPRYEELLTEHVYVRHMLRRPPEEWPEHVVRSFDQINRDIYVPLQGPSELGSVGLLEQWDRFEDLARIEVPALVMAATHDTMDPEHKRAMADRLPRGRFHLSPDGSHIAVVDDHDTYLAGLEEFLRDLAKEAGA